MALPNKKQLNTHKRGTRKALDTLDALENLEDEINDDIQEDTPPKKAVKKPKKKPKKQKKAKSSTKKTEDTPVDEAAPPVEQGEKAEDKDTATDKKSIDLGEDFVTPEPSKPQESPAEEDKDVTPESIELSEETPSDLEATENAPENDVMEPANSDTDAKPETSANQAEAPSGQVATKEKDGDGQTDEDTLKDRYLTFRIGKEDYGLEIRYVTEIIVMQRITEVPDTPPHIKGVINLRGMVIPVMDVRQRFHLEPREYDDRTCIVVVDFEGLAVGMIVDVVNEVVDILDSDIDPPPAAHSGIQVNYIMGMGKVGKKVKIILDVEKVLDRKTTALHDA